MTCFNDLLSIAGIAPKDVSLILHNPTNVDSRSLLLAMADDEPDLFMAYQDNHPRIQEATLKSRPIAASFVGDNKEARFVELYAVESWTNPAPAELDSAPQYQEIVTRMGLPSFVELATKSGGQGRAIFTLRPLEVLRDLRGRLIVSRPEGRNHVRLAEKCNMPILAVERTARFAPPAPDWNEFVVTATELRGLPLDWQGRLREWRGIYHIIDTTDGQRYVGSAYGETNLLGRWKAHVARDIGVTAELARRDPVNFRFSILELLSPSATSDEVLQAEVRWKERLGTITWGLNRN